MLFGVTGNYLDILKEIKKSGIKRISMEEKEEWTKQACCRNCVFFKRGNDGEGTCFKWYLQVRNVKNNASITLYKGVMEFHVCPAHARRQSY